MALKNNQGNYLKIVSYNNDFIQVEIYRNELSRREFVDEFEQKRLDVIHIDNLKEQLKTISDPSKSIYDNLITRLYELLKTQERFNNWEDC